MKQYSLCRIKEVDDVIKYYNHNKNDIGISFNRDKKVMFYNITLRQYIIIKSNLIEKIDFDIYSLVKKELINFLNERKIFKPYIKFINGKNTNKNSLKHYIKTRSMSNCILNFSSNGNLFNLNKSNKIRKEWSDKIKEIENFLIDKFK